MKKPIKVGDSFTFKAEHWIVHGIRLPDDPNPVFDYERIRVRILADDGWKIPQQEFPAEPEWFRQRGLEVSD